MAGGMGGMAGMMGGGGAFAGAAPPPVDVSGIMSNPAVFGRIAEISPEWSPFPILQQMDQLQGMQGLELGAPSGFGFVNPEPLPQAAGPLASPGAPQGPLVVPQDYRATLPTPPAAKQAPLTPQQMAALAAAGRAGQGAEQRPPGAVAPQGGRGQIQLSPITLPGVTGGRPIPGLAQILGRR